METVAQKLPVTFDEREPGPDELRVPATLDEYWELVEEVDYAIEYLNGEIISFMGQASDVHETLFARLIYLLEKHFDADLTYRVMGSNVKTFSEASAGSLNADLSVVKGPSDFKVLPSGRLSKAIIRNPEIVVEVLSPGTRNYDVSEKLICYKMIPTLQHVLFVDQKRPYASVYSRLPEPDQWLNVDYCLLTDTVKVGDLTLPMQEIYRKTPFSVTA
ncbi:MAG: Uma2 family endonuclease [Bacteroidetes bacterium]|nr:Uma2 family endonuclease [Fibrella sp.]